MFLYNHDRQQIRNWINALRSGQFPQSRFKLQDDKGFCCFGVACKITIPEVLQAKTDDKLLGTIPYEQNAAPKWLTKINMASLRRLGSASLFDLNDNLYFTFKQIADVIEATFLMEPDHKALLKYMDAYNDK